MSKLNELREKRASIAAQMSALVKAGLNAENKVQFDKMDADQEAVASEIRAIEKTEALETELRSVAGRVENAQVGSSKSGEKRDFGKEYAGAFAKYLRNGASSLAEIREIANALPRDREGRIELRTDDQTASMWGNVTGQSYSGTSGTQGGVFVPASFMYAVDVATKYYAPLMTEGVCRVIETATGAVLPYPTANDTSNSAAVLADATQDTEQSVPLGVVNFGAYKYTSRIVRVSLELLQDSAFNLEDFLKAQFAIRFGRGYEAAFTTGTGSGQPTGILTAVIASGVTPVVGAGSNANDGLNQTANLTIGTNDLIALEHSVDPTYRRGAKFMLADSTLKVVKQLLDKYGRPIWVPGLASNAPDTILGYGYTINQSLPSVGASKNTTLFGDMSKFIIRKVRDMSVLRLDERYADFGQVGFIAFSRVDSNLVDAGTHPINYLQQHS
jgi:HK97 family phage major capsid protein